MSSSQPQTDTDLPSRPERDRFTNFATIFLSCLVAVSVLAIPVVNAYLPSKNLVPFVSLLIVKDTAAKDTGSMAALTTGGVVGTSVSQYFNSAARPRIVLFGDSLTERGFEVPGGWAAALASNYTRRADVVNRGLSGYNSRWALRTLKYVFGPPAGSSAVQSGAARVLFATVLFGANDAARLQGPSHSARQHVPVEEYANNLKEIISYIRATGVDRIVLLTPPPVWAPGRKVHQIQRMGEQARDWPLDRTLEDTAPYAEAAAKLGAEAGVPVLDLFNLLQQEDKWGERLLCDGLHFTPAGQDKLWQLLQELLVREWPEIRPEVLPTQFPAWDAIDFNDVPATFAATDVSA